LGLGEGLTTNVTKGLGINDPCEQGNETSSFIKGGKFLDYVTISFSKKILLLTYLLTNRQII